MSIWFRIWFFITARKLRGLEQKAAAARARLD